MPHVLTQQFYDNDTGQLTESNKTEQPGPAWVARANRLGRIREHCSTYALTDQAVIVPGEHQTAVLTWKDTDEWDTSKGDRRPSKLGATA